ncbi:Ribosomal large subunit pseudouridine synthase C [Halomonadaceae bacterium LMG 33818]|uniref:RluA family pseudouridine synthase n=1 Tax=Cernens ardua TaxID=3402176 RepID=UPI003EDB864E
MSNKTEETSTSNSNPPPQGQGVQWLEVTSGQEGQRLDNFLMSRLKGAPKSLVYRIIRRGEVRVNKSRAKADTRLTEGDVVRVPPLRLAPKEAVQEVSENLANLLMSSVIAESEHWMALNKPAGLAVHGGTGVKIGLIEALRQVRTDLDFLELVHRLDRDTSGVILIAKSREGLLKLSDAIKHKKMDKRYWALVEGFWPEQREWVSAPLQRYEGGNGERRVRVDQQGKRSRTTFRVIEAFEQCTLIEASPITGRTHQIRVHAAHVGHPLLHDVKYGTHKGMVLSNKLSLERLFLHAHSLAFDDPQSGRRINLKARLDPALEAVLAEARKAR